MSGLFTNTGRGSRSGGVMSVSPSALDLSFEPDLSQPCARILVIRPARDVDDAITLNGAARSFDEFQRYLDRLETDIRLLRESARAAFEERARRQAKTG